MAASAVEAAVPVEATARFSEGVRLLRGQFASIGSSSAPPHFRRLQLAVARARLQALEAADSLLALLEEPPRTPPAALAAQPSPGPRFVAVGDLPPQEVARSGAELARLSTCPIRAASDDAAAACFSGDRTLAAVLGSGLDGPASLSPASTASPATTQASDRSSMWETPKMSLFDSPIAPRSRWLPAQASSSSRSWLSAAVLADGSHNVRFLPAARAMRATCDVEAATETRTRPPPPASPLSDLPDRTAADLAETARAVEAMPDQSKKQPPEPQGGQTTPPSTSACSSASADVVGLSDPPPRHQSTAAARFTFKKEIGPDAVLRAMDAAELAMDTRDQVANAMEAATLSVRAAAAEASAAFAGAFAFRASLASSCQARLTSLQRAERPSLRAWTSEAVASEAQGSGVSADAAVVDRGAAAEEHPQAFLKGRAAPSVRSSCPSSGAGFAGGVDAAYMEPPTFASWKSGVDIWFANVDRQRQAASDRLTAMIERPVALSPPSAASIGARSAAASDGGSGCRTQMHSASGDLQRSGAPMLTSSPVTRSEDLDFGFPHFPRMSAKPPSGPRSSSLTLSKFGGREAGVGSTASAVARRSGVAYSGRFAAGARGAVATSNAPMSQSADGPVLLDSCR